MKNVVLLQSVVGAWDEVKSAYSVPLSLLQSVVLVDKAGYEVKLIDQRGNPNWKKDIENNIDSQTLWVGTTCMCGPQITHALDMLVEVKRNYPNIPTVMGGKHASLIPEVALAEPVIDSVMIGDAELSALKLTQSLDAGKTINDLVSGINTKFFNGKPAFYHPYDLNLNDLPITPYHLVDVKKFLPKWQDHKILDVFTSQGCPFSCTFCYNPTVYGPHKWRAMSSETVLNHVRELKQKYDIEGIFFVDDEFFADLMRARRIIEGIKDMGLVYQIQGTSVNSVYNMDKDYLAALEKSGCTQMNMGVESASMRVLGMVCKTITPTRVRAVNRNLAPFNIVPWYYFMIGFPDETLSEIKSTVQLALDLLKDNPHARISPFACFTPYPATPMYDLAKKHGFIPPKTFNDWATFATDNINTPWIDQDRFKLINTLQFTSLFIDGKPEDRLGSSMMKLLAKAYRPIARYRFSHLNSFASGPERYLGFKIRDRMGKSQPDER